MEPDTTEGKELSYDLRQYQAKLIGEQIFRVKESMDLEPYKYFSELEKLYMDSHHKFKDLKNNEQYFETMCNEIVQLSYKNKSAWSGQNNMVEYGLIKTKLNKLYLWLMMRLEEANLFGTKYSEDENEL